MEADHPRLFPSAREICAAQDGASFFIKWVMCAGAIVVLASFAQGMAFATRTAPGTPVGYFPRFPNLLLLVVPLFLPAWALFHFGWRAWAWWISSIVVGYGAFYLPSIGQWDWARRIVLMMIPQVFLLWRTRRRVWLWAIVFPLAQWWDILFGWRASDGQQNVVVRTLWKWMTRIPFAGAWQVIALWNCCQLMGAILTGAALAWCMPAIVPCTETKATTRGNA